MIKILQTMNDAQVCEHCQELDGMEFTEEEIKNFVFHPPSENSSGCRCVFVEKINTKIVIKNVIELLMELKKDYCDMLYEKDLIDTTIEQLKKLVKVERQRKR